MLRYNMYAILIDHIKLYFTFEQVTWRKYDSSCK